MYTVVGFLELSCAFDATWPPSILKHPLEKSCPKYLVKILRSFLEERQGIIEDGDDKFIYQIHIDCPQGSVLSLFLWIVLIDHILRRIFPFIFKIIAYADDIAMVKEPK